MFIKFNTKQRILSHLLFWCCIIGLFIFTTIVKGSSIKNTLLLNLALLPMDMIGAYTVIYIIIPRFLFAKKYLLFFITFFCFTIVYAFFVAIPYEYFLATNYFEADKWGNVVVFTKARILWTLVILTMINGLAAFIKVSKHWLYLQQEKQQVEKDIIQLELKFKESELKLLKAQIHPHFLFNTLNNLYGLTLEKSDMASEVVVKLSEMLDYMLYECNENLVPLEKEIKLLENYIALEKIRHDESLDIALTIDGQLKNLKIAPLILLPFIENAFKHGMSKQADNKWLHINIKVEDLILKYSVNNSKELAENIANQVSEGIGLENLKKRLGLQYKNDFKLDIINSENEFKAYLELKLAS